MRKMKAMCFLTGAALAILCHQPAQAEGPAPYAFERGHPAADTSKRARDDADFQRAIIAYRFWYPSVSVEGIFNGNREAGLKDGEKMGIAAAGPRQIGFTLNSDTPYGSAVIDVTKGPVVVELPPGPYIGLVNDHNQGWVMDLGLPGPDAGKGGKHVVLGPDYKGEVPEGYHVARSNSYKNLLAVRALPVGGDVTKAMDALRAIKIHPLGSSTNLAVVDTTKEKMDSSSLRWEDNFQFWQVLKQIVDEEPVVPSFLPMYGLLAELGIEKGTPFVPDARMRDILDRAARAGRDQMLVSAFDSARADRVNWPDRKWEWVGLTPGSAQFETSSGMDLEARDRWFAQAIVTSPAMFRRSAGAGSLYWMSVRDDTGAFLDGAKNYKLAMPQPVPGKLFWSITVYDTQTRSQVQTDQDRGALRSMFELSDIKGTVPADLFFGPDAPQGNESHWIKTPPGRGWFAYIRIYGPEEAAFDKSWKPGDFTEVKAGTMGSATK
ncbi:DUF1254 domain-containing protein [Bradyrhizobium sp. UFLA05-109]